MGLINLPNVDEIAQEKDPRKQMEMVVNTVGLLMKSLSELNGYLNSKNVFEQGGWRVKSDELTSKDNDVGMSTADTGTDDVRFWAGGIDKNTAPWRVTKSGKMVATGALIRSKDGVYPLVVLDPDNDLFGAYGSETQYIVIEAFGNTLTPFLQWVEGTSEAKMYMSGTQLKIISADVGMKISVLGALELDPVDLYLSPNNLVHVNNWTDLFADNLGESLQDALDAKVDSGDSTSVNGTHNHGIPDGTVLMVEGGGTVTFLSSGSHFHTV